MTIEELISSEAIRIANNIEGGSQIRWQNETHEETAIANIVAGLRRFLEKAKQATIETEILQTGWGFPSNSKKAHYFLNGDRRSLCLKWAFFGTLETGNNNSPDNCSECKKRLAKMVNPK